MHLYGNRITNCEIETRIVNVRSISHENDCMFYKLMCTFCEIARENLQYTLYRNISLNFLQPRRLTIGRCVYHREVLIVARYLIHYLLVAVRVEF